MSKELPLDFDEELYFILNPDVKGQYKAEEHYLKYGYNENRKYKIEIPDEFNEKLYYKLNPDVQCKYDAKEHYLKYGYLENRKYKVEIPEDFDENEYLNLYPDVKKEFPDKAAFHYMNHGYFENRKYNIKKPVIIYILCYNEVKYKDALEIYRKYKWAKPIILLNQDYSFENAFWKQLLEIKKEWETNEMVGTLSYSAYKKIDLNIVDKIISKKLYIPNSYYNFFDTNVSIPNSNTKTHPHFNSIWNDLLLNLKLFPTTENCCNYWMCKPELMEKFIYWYINKCLPELLNNPFILENANYQNNSLNPNTLNKEGLINLWGKPYYPNFPFIVERLNKCFFMTNYKVVFLISHENTLTGAVNAILNVKYIYEKNNVKTILLYLPDIVKKNIDIVSFIKEESEKLNCCPIVICNTLCCYNIVRTLSITNITTYWYIHEWYEPNGYFDFLQKNFDLFNSNINIIFICKKSYQQYKKFILNIKNEIIIYNKIPLEVLNDKKNKQPEVPINKVNNELFIVIIGTVDERKNQQKFIDDVFYKITNIYPTVKLVIVGKIIVKLNIKQEYKDNIICTGLVSNALPYIELSDIVVSYSNNEVYPLSILETFYCSKPFVSSNVGGIDEIIENGKNGFLFENNDYKSCFNILSKLIENKQLRKKIGEYGYKKFLENSNDNISTEQFLLLLSKPIYN